MWWYHRAGDIIWELVPLRCGGFNVEIFVARVVSPATFVDIQTSNSLRGSVLETCVSMALEGTYGGTIGLGISLRALSPEIY